MSRLYFKRENIYESEFIEFSSLKNYVYNNECISEFSLLLLKIHPIELYDFDNLKEKYEGLLFKEILKPYSLINLLYNKKIFDVNYLKDDDDYLVKKIHNRIDISSYKTNKTVFNETSSLNRRNRKKVFMGLTSAKAQFYNQANNEIIEIVKSIDDLSLMKLAFVKDSFKCKKIKALVLNEKIDLVELTRSQIKKGRELYKDVFSALHMLQLDCFFEDENQRDDLKSCSNENLINYIGYEPIIKNYDS